MTMVDKLCAGFGESVHGYLDIARKELECSEYGIIHNESRAISTAKTDRRKIGMQSVL